VHSSAGIALFPGHADDTDAPIRRSGVALTRARVAGTAVALYKSGLDLESAQRMSLMSEVRGAIERDELLLYCQSKVRVSH
jgi:predicted signal transduction protein with EAL and GGDEF domain